MRPMGGNQYVWGETLKTYWQTRRSLSDRSVA